MHTVGIFDDLINIISKGVASLMERVHLECATTLSCYTIVVPPREFWYENLLIVTLHEEIVDGILEYLLATISQQHLLLRHTVDLAQSHRYHTLLALIVDTGVEAQCLWVEVFYSLNNFLRRLKVKLISVKVVHRNKVFFYYVNPSFLENSVAKLHFFSQIK